MTQALEAGKSAFAAVLMAPDGLSENFASGALAAQKALFN
jgi:hypothetical protein